MAALNSLPNELLTIVAENLERPKDVANLALASRRLNEFAKLDGWKAFLKGRFKLSGYADATDAKEAVHGIATLYRNWDRKSFLARYLVPTTTTSLNTWETSRWRGLGGPQTMGYQPSIDSYEETFGRWTERREVLAWSAGNQIMLRIKESGRKSLEAWEEYGARANSTEPTDAAHSSISPPFDLYKHLTSWCTYEIPHTFAGMDDITALKLFRPHQRLDHFESVAFGTASGHLNVLHIDADGEKTRRHCFETGHRPVGALSLSCAASPLMAVSCRDFDSALSLYPIDPSHTGHNRINPVSQVIPTAPGAQHSRIWSCNFLAEDRVAIGLGTSYEPIQVYSVTPSGFSAQPLRKFCLDSKFWGEERPALYGPRNTAIYPIMPLPAASPGSSESGDVFVSGGYDGIVRLHDMRSNQDYETMFWDITNDSSIYSIATQGLERIVAGSSMHSMLKVFDLRVSGSNAYHHIPLSARRKPAANSGDASIGDAVLPGNKSPVTGGWNLYCNPCNNQQSFRNPQQRFTARSQNVPIYSLSIPSSTSPTVYAGVEGAVLGIEFTAILDPHPDPLFTKAITRFSDTGEIDLKGSYNPSDDVLNLGMYEQGDEEALG
ncbi:hypothetical protein P154DRAFT_471170, partial [Amniculicola lignicola CBS 123094]